MTSVHLDSAQPHSARPTASFRRRRGPTLRLLAVLGTIAALSLALHFGDPNAALAADPDLARLLRGMAAIKALLVVAAFAILMWRFTHPIERRTATGYLVGVWLMAAATGLIWQLTAIVPAAVSFHVGALLVLVVAWRDGGVLGGLRRKAPRY